MASTIQGDNGASIVYVDGVAVNSLIDEIVDGETPPDVSVSFDAVENGYTDDLPNHWLNSARISFGRETNDGVSVCISCGDPRGAFCMTLRRMDDGTLILHVPHAGDGMLHMPLTELHPGTYRVG